MVYSACALWLLPAAAALSPTPPPPPRMTPTQQRIMAATAASAEAASSAAEAPLHALLGSTQFAAALGGCCPELRGQTPARLLQLYGEQVAVTEVAHGFFAVNPPAQNNAADLNLTQAAAASWFYNEWQLQVLYPRAGKEIWDVIGGSCSLGPAAAAELGIFGLPPFSKPIPRVPGAFPGGWPATLAEASDRVVYTLFNQRRTALPTAPWGDVSVVFAPSLARDAVLLSPFDTGDYEVGCNETYQQDMDKAFERDCALQKTEAGCEAMGFMCQWANGKCSSGRVAQRRRMQRGGSMCNWTLGLGKHAAFCRLGGRRRRLRGQAPADEMLPGWADMDQQQLGVGCGYAPAAV